MNEINSMINKMRQPIVAVLGHVDAGKTTLLDKIRQTTIARKEPGEITQHIGSTNMPISSIKKICGPLIKRFKINFEVPGLLFIDTPGHEAFTSLRKRGGSISDMAVLVIDTFEGLMPQTIESLNILRAFKVPFVIAMTKIDKIQGWESKNESFLENIKNQREDVLEQLDKYLYNIVGQLSKYGINSERFDRTNDFTKTVSIIPCSGKTGEGIPEIIVMIIGLAQQYLKGKLNVSGKCYGSIIEVKDMKGIGKSLDVILYDGIAHKGDYIVIGGTKPEISKIKALFLPRPLQDIRAESKFVSFDKVFAACGVRIVPQKMENVLSGLPIAITPNYDEAVKISNELRNEAHNIEIDTNKHGLVIKCDAIGSLEAIKKIFEGKVPIKYASVGPISKEDIFKAEGNEELLKVVMGFNTKILPDAQEVAKSKGIKIIQSNVIYRLTEEFEEFQKHKKMEIQLKELENVTHPGKFKILPGCIFRASKPAIVGCKIIGGLIKPGYNIFKLEKTGKINKNINGKIKQIQVQGKNIDIAKKGDDVAISIDGSIVGRGLKENDIFYTNVLSKDYKKLKKYENLLTKSEKEVLEEIKELNKKFDPLWDLRD